jgi:predicted aconitase with swiveling domain
MTDPAARRLHAVALSEGGGQGTGFTLQEPLSFWGGLEAPSGRIIDRQHPQCGDILTGKILVMQAGRGSSSGSSVLAEAIRLGTGPAGIILMTRDAIVTVGAMIAAELYGKRCPVVLAKESDWSLLVRGKHISITAQDDLALIELTLKEGDQPPLKG